MINRIVIDQVINNKIKGWISSSKDELPMFDVEIQDNFTKDFIAVEISTSNRSPKKFNLEIKTDLKELDITRLSISIKSEEETLAPQISRGLRIANNLNQLNSNQLENFVRNISQDSFNQLTQIFNRVQSRTLVKRRKCCVITYANDASAYFPYFHQYYSEIIEPTSIYVITPKPASFAEYELGGLINVEGFEFEENGRAHLQSKLSSALQAYYEWTLICDVDEIVMPNPSLNKTFHELLGKDNNQKVIRTLGIDVVQLPNEEKLDFNTPILKQRKVGVLNSSICKPHFASDETSYSVGFHFVNEKSIIKCPPDFITYHLKWACSSTRAEILDIVNNTQFSQTFVEDYCKSTAEASQHPRLDQLIDNEIYALVSEFTNTFIESFNINMELNIQNRKWVSRVAQVKNLISLA